MRRIAWRSSSFRMNSTRVRTSCATDRCTSSGSAFQRRGELAAVRSSSRRRSSSSATSVTVTPPPRATTLVRRFRRVTGTRLFVVIDQIFSRGPGAAYLPCPLVPRPLVPRPSHRRGKCIRRKRTRQDELYSGSTSGCLQRSRVRGSRTPRNEVIHAGNSRTKGHLLLMNPSPDRMPQWRKQTSRFRILSRHTTPQVLRARTLSASRPPRLCSRGPIRRPHNVHRGVHLAASVHDEDGHLHSPAQALARGA